MTPNSQGFFKRSYQDVISLLALALPILGAQLSTTAMGFADTSMSGRVSPEDLAAIAVGASLWTPVYVFIRGVLMAATPSVAQLYAGGSQKEIAPLVRQTLWIALACAALAIFFLNMANIPMAWLDVDPAITPLASQYLQALCWGIPAMTLYVGLCCYSEGMADTRPGLFFGIAGLMINIPANYILIYGKFGAPALGAVGCGHATALSFWAMLVMLMVYLSIRSNHRNNGIFNRWEWPAFRTIGSLLKLGIPIGLAIFSEALLFSIIALLIGFMGPVIVAGHQLSLNFSSLVFMIPLSLAIANTIRVGQSIGSKDPYRARFVAYTGIATSVGFSAISAVLILLFPEAIIRIYTDDPAVTAVAAGLLVYAAVYQIADAIQIGSSGALRGYKDTFWPLVLALFSYWGVAFPVGYTLGLTDLLVPAMGPEGLWIGLVVGLCISAILNSARLYRISRQFIRRLQ